LSRIRIAVIGAGQFGRNHCRVVNQSKRAALAAVVDLDAARAADAARASGAPALTSIEEVAELADAAIVATPTVSHAEVGCRLMEAGLDVLVEKPVAPDLASADRLVETAARCGRVLQVGHLERFNPAVQALAGRVTLPLFFEVHRLSVFSPRSLDIDVVLDLMIHDIDLVLHLTGAEPREIKAAGISILSPKVDIANVRLDFANGCVANLTASRVSTDRVRKLRIFQPRQYISLDYARQDISMFTVGKDHQIGFESVPVCPGEPLARQFDAFLDCIQNRSVPASCGDSARRTLRVGLAILDRIEEHAEIVRKTLVAGWTP
jgi:predicted dehydrogenase